MTDKAQGAAERQQFEAWCGSERYRFVVLNRMSGDRYVHPGVQADWEVWRAARAALKAQPAPADPLQHLVDQAQGLDMGYGKGEDGARVDEVST